MGLGKSPNFCLLETQYWATRTWCVGILPEDSVLHHHFELHSSLSPISILYGIQCSIYSNRDPLKFLVCIEITYGRVTLDLMVWYDIGIAF